MTSEVLTEAKSSEARKRNTAPAATPATAGSRRRVNSQRSNKSKSIGRQNQELGKRGEDAAVKYLYMHGYEIVERNWVCKAGEADIIARDGKAIVFVEVKTRRNTDKGFPSEAVSKEKRAKYEKIALSYLRDFPETDIPVRFDVVSLVALGNDRALIQHSINAFAVD